MYTLRLLVALDCGSLSIGQLYGMDETLRGTATFRVVDSYSGGALVGANLSIQGEPGRQAFNRVVMAASTVDVPYGRYTVVVRARGWVTTQVSLVVDKPRMWKTVGLTLDSPVDGARSPVVSGTVVSRGQPVPLAWVKIVAVYSDVAVETLADNSGDFGFRGLQDGLYILTSASSDGFVSQAVRVRGDCRGLALELRVLGKVP